MERGDISDFAVIGQACVFEGLLASPPATRTGRLRTKYYTSREEWDTALKLWKPHDLPLKSLIDSVKRLKIATVVITFLSEEATDPIYRWLLRKGVMTTVEFYESPEAYANDLRYNRAIKSVWVPTKDIAYTLGMRAVVTSPDKSWNL